MDKHFSWSKTALFASLAVCLVAVAAGGSFLLLGRSPQSEPVQDTVREDTAPPQPTAANPARPLTAETPEEEPPAPQPVQETPFMPELPVAEVTEEVPVFDTAPIAAEEPRVVVEPLVGEVVAAFSVSELQYDPTFRDWRIHDGVDIAAAAGTEVLSAAAGTVFSVGEDPLMGVTVVIDHDDGCRATYANLAASPAVRAGDSVHAGEVIGAVGETALAESARGSHLHFSVSRDGDVVDPHAYLYQ